MHSIFGYKLTYVESDTSKGKHYSFSGGRAFRMPYGETITCYLKPVSDAFTIDFTMAQITYYNSNGGHYTIAGSSAVTSFPKTTNSLRCSMTALFTVSGSPAIGGGITKIQISIFGTYIDQDCTITLLTDGSWKTVKSITSAGTYRVTATDAETGNRSALSTTINNLPTYDGASYNQVTSTVNLKCTIGSATAVKQSAAKTYQMTA